MVSQTIIDLNGAIHDKVIGLLVGEHRGSLVDLGAGDGTLAKRLQKEGFDVTAVDAVTDDFRPTDIEVTAANLNEGIPFADGQFHVVVSTEVIEHLENPWLFVRELYRITEPGGVVIISTPNLSNVYVRAWYALTGRLYNFLNSAYQHIGHITPVYLWNLERMVEDKFDIEVVTVNASPIPKTRFRLPTGSRVFGQCIVVKLRRRPGAAVKSARVWANSRIVRLRVN
ncbi:MAG TPA: methyltransferase domain-containing protein [Trebonia sp.]|jgi:SAM-dependent methyltransferase|nr:methyltransferase domain-containing protein [Trebonia sp.]